MGVGKFTWALNTIQNFEKVSYAAKKMAVCIFQNDTTVLARVPGLKLIVFISDTSDYPSQKIPVTSSMELVQ